MGQRHREIGPHVEDGPARAGGVGRAQFAEIRALDGVSPRQQVEEQDADGVDLAGDRRRPPHQQLRRHVGWRAARIVLDPAFEGESEVHQQDSATLLAHHVARLDVAVEQSHGVNGADRPADVDDDEGRLARAQRTLRGEQTRERGALHEVAPESHSPVVQIHAVDRQHVGVAQSRDRPGFQKECTGLVVSIEAARQQQLQGDVALECRVERAVDLAERAAPTRWRCSNGPSAQRLRRWCVGEGSRSIWDSSNLGSIKVLRRLVRSLFDAVKTLVLGV